MKRCECGCEEFNTVQVRRYWCVVSGGNAPIWDRDSEDPDNPYDNEIVGDFECVQCGTNYENWNDIPDANPAP